MKWKFAGIDFTVRFIITGGRGGSIVHGSLQSNGNFVKLTKFVLGPPPLHSATAFTAQKWIQYKEIIVYDMLMI